MKSQDSGPVSKPRLHTMPWGHLWSALAISVVGTAVVGGVLFLLQQNIWWLAVGGLLSLFSASLYLGRRTHEPEPLYGVVLAVLYFGLVVGILFGGELAEALPDPLPGLAIGDSTFFFVSPLLMLVVSVAGSVMGGHWREANG